MNELDLTSYDPGTLHPHLEDGDRTPSYWISDDASDAIDVAVGEGRPVVYVDCGGLRSDACDELRSIVPSALLGIVVDHDIDLALPGGHAGDFDPAVGPWSVAACDTPSLWLAALEIDRHEEARGPCIVVLDNIETARPWHGAIDSAGTGPRVSAMRITATQARRWAPRELARFAAARPNAITIALTRSVLFDEDIVDYLATAA